MAYECLFIGKLDYWFIGISWNWSWYNWLGGAEPQYPPCFWFWFVLNLFSIVCFLSMLDSWDMFKTKIKVVKWDGGAWSLCSIVTCVFGRRATMQMNWQVNRTKFCCGARPPRGKKTSMALIMHRKNLSHEVSHVYLYVVKLSIGKYRSNLGDQDQCKLTVVILRFHDSTKGTSFWSCSRRAAGNFHDLVPCRYLKPPEPSATTREGGKHGHACRVLPVQYLGCHSHGFWNIKGNWKSINRGVSRTIPHFMLPFSERNSFKLIPLSCCSHASHLFNPKVLIAQAIHLFEAHGVDFLKQKFTFGNRSNWRGEIQRHLKPLDLHERKEQAIRNFSVKQSALFLCSFPCSDPPPMSG